MRGKSVADSSLELLLDTICNTFGGVLFLAILVCILLRNAGHTSAQQQVDAKFTENDVIELVRHRTEVESELAGLRAAAERQNQVASSFITPGAAEILKAQEDAQRERQSLEDARREALASIALKQARIVEMEREINSLTQRTVEARKLASESENALTSELKAHTVSTATPARARLPQAASRFRCPVWPPVPMVTL